MTDSDLDRLDDFLVRIRVAHQRPAWRRRLLGGSDHLRGLADLRILRAVERQSSGDEGPSIGDIADHLGIEHSTASRAVTNVVRAGLLAKSPSDADQRRSQLELTERGRQALAETTARRRELVAEAVAGWSASDLGHLTGLLSRLADDFEVERNA